MSPHREGHPPRHKGADHDERRAVPAPPAIAEAPRPAPGEGQGVPTPAEDLLAPGEKERLELVDRLQRLAAEFSNYQKRTDRRIEEERREAVRRLVLDLLPAIDGFDRAMAAAEATRDFQALFEGIRLVHGQLLAGLATHGITPIETGRSAFDPQHHEAVAHLPSREHPAGQVIEETQRGYRFGDQVLRASRVAVSSGKPGDGAGALPPAAEGGDAPEPNGGTEGGAQGEGA